MFTKKIILGLVSVLVVIVLAITTLLITCSVPEEVVSPVVEPSTVVSSPPSSPVIVVVPPTPMLEEEVVPTVIPTIPVFPSTSTPAPLPKPTPESLTIISVTPKNDTSITGWIGAYGTVAVTVQLSIVFNIPMNPESINDTTFHLFKGVNDPVAGVFVNTPLVATFIPKESLVPGSVYKVVLTTGATSLDGQTLSVDYKWEFKTTGFNASEVVVVPPPAVVPTTTPTTVPTTTPTTTPTTVPTTTPTVPPTTTPPTVPVVSLAPVNLRTAGNFVILTKSGISTTGTTAITGDIGVSPIAASFITGFGLIADSSNQWATSSLVTGKVYAANYATPTPAKMTTAVGDMQTAYTDAAGRTLPDFTELYAGNISGKTLTAGLYKWGTGLLIDGTGCTLTGSATDVFIFQIAGTLTAQPGAIITLSGGVLPENIFWQVAGQTTLGTTVQFKGNILCMTAIVMNTGASLEGRALAQTAVTLNANVVTKP